MFRRVYVERDVADHPRTRRILEKLSCSDIRPLERIDQVFGRVRKPYLQKRTKLDLFLGKKRGALVKKAPPAYGLNEGAHYFFVLGYNCLFECEYCYLQGYFKSPDIVLFINHEDVVREMEATLQEHPKEETVWFHGAEYTDSLALAGLSDEWPPYWRLMASHPNARLELRSKSGNIRPLLGLEALPNVIPSFSLAPESQIARYEHKTAPLAARLRAVRALAQKGYSLGIHLDPVIYAPDLKSQYQGLIGELLSALPEEQLSYLSIGVVRFTKSVLKQMAHHYPDSSILAEEMVTSFDGKVRYPRPFRLRALRMLRGLCLEAGICPSKVYLCMEDDGDLP